MYKLVRDKVIDIARAEGIIIDAAQILNDEFFNWAIREKLYEEIQEYFQSDDSLEELCDIQLVINTIVGDRKEEFKALYAKKLEEKGGFDRRIIGFFPDPMPEIPQE
jgi:predicted house-cleaning noncanonical NTP pyrophosphatase (MazG superfamily)